MSLHLQQQAATSVDDTEEDLEDAHAPRGGSRGGRKNQFVIELNDQYLGKKRKRVDNHGSEAERTWSKLEREEIHVEGVIRQTIQKASLMLSENSNDLALIDINSYLDTLSRLVRALEALQSAE